MCFDHDSRPPIRPIAGGSIDAGPLTLTADDGTTVRAFRARAAQPTGAGMIVLPDVRGLHPYYEELALRFAEHGIDALAIDYFGRTAPDEPRGPDFDHAPHVAQTSFAGLSSDVRAAARHLRSDEGGGVDRLFTIGFCFGGRLAFLTATLDLDLAGVVGFYGWPIGRSRNDTPAPADVADRCGCPVLAIFGGADEGIPPAAVTEFETALKQAGVAHRVIVYPDAPHSFFDRKSEDFADTSSDAWQQVVAFVESPGAPGSAP